MSLQIYKAQSTVFPLVTEFPSWLYIFWQVETTFCPFIHIHDLPGPYNPSGDAGQILLMESPAQESPKMSLWRCCRMPFQNLHKSRALPRQGECRLGHSWPLWFLLQGLYNGALDALDAPAASPAPGMKAHWPMDFPQDAQASSDTVLVHTHSLLHQTGVSAYPPPKLYCNTSSAIYWSSFSGLKT